MSTMLSQTQAIPIWLDCDPGHDDAFAILLVLHHPRFRLLGISTVHGNASLEHTTINAHRLLAAYGRSDVPVYPGAAAPLQRKAVFAENVHGASGLDGTTLLPPAPESPSSPQPPSTRPDTQLGAIEAMRAALLPSTSSNLPGQASTPSPWIIATGPLTNIALLLSAHPEVAGHIGGLSIMGGAIGGGFTDAVFSSDGVGAGNVTKWAEFNVWADPEAAHAVLSHPSLVSTGKTTLIPLDITHKVIATKGVSDQLCGHETSSTAATKAPSSKLRPLLREIIAFFAHTYATQFGFIDGPPVHDPVAVAVLISGIFEKIAAEGEEGTSGGKEPKPDVETNMFDMEVLLEGEQSGRTVATKVVGGRGHEGEVTGAKRGVRIPNTINVDRFWEVMSETVTRAETHLKKMESGTKA